MAEKAEINTAELRSLIDKHGPPLSPMMIFTLLDEVDRLREALEASRTLHANLLAHLRETG